MARVTVEDCFDKVGSRFELVIIASQRGKELNHGTPSLIQTEKVKKEKESIIALREIAAGLIDIEKIKSILVNSFLSRGILDVEISPQLPEIDEIFKSDTEAQSQEGLANDKSIASDQIYQDDETIEEE